MGRTYESLEALLIAVSPTYARRMAEEVMKRFAGHDAGREESIERDDGREGEIESQR
jgi:hypothetical protein